MSKTIDSQNKPADELPLPEDYYRRLGIASRPTFYRWGKAGLRVLHVGGRRYIYPSDLREFMETKSAEKSAAVSGTKHREGGV